MSPQEFWAVFLDKTGRDSATPCFECFHFELSERWANDLLALVLSGKKRATTSSLYSFTQNGGRPPQVGDLSIVTDWAGEPHCIIETTAVRILPFNEVDYALCRLEGEDDCLASWQAGHRRYLTAEGAELGYAFSEEMPVVFEEFAVVFRR